MLYPKNAMLENNLGHFHIQTYAQAKHPCKVKLNTSLTEKTVKQCMNTQMPQAYEILTLCIYPGFISFIPMDF